MSDWWMASNYCPKRWEIEDVFWITNMRTPIITYVVNNIERRFHLLLDLDTFRNMSSDCFNMYIEEIEEKGKESTPFMFSVWIEGSDQTKHFYSKCLVNKSLFHIWSVSRHKFLKKYEHLKEYKDGSEILPFVFKFEPPLNIKQENDLADNLEGDKPIKQGPEGNETETEDVITRCKNLLAGIAKSIQSDFVLISEDDTFPVNKTDLRDRCETFADDMLINSDNGTVKVTDMDSVVLALLLIHIYSEDLPNFSAEIAPRVFRASIKYRLMKLVIRSISFPTGLLTEKDIDDLLSYAITCENDFMFNIIYSMQHPEEILQSNAWTDFTLTREEWACDVYHSYFRKRSQMIED